MAEIAVGLIGYGLAGSVFHAPLIQATPGLRLAAVVTSRAVSGIPVVNSVDAVLHDSAIDLVVVAAPTSTHFEIARAALLAGKHVVVDKPIATTSKEADALIALAAETKRHLSVFQNRRWDGDFLTIENCVREGLLGQVSYYEAHFDRFRPQIKPGWRERPGAGSGILYDLGAHLIDHALHLFGMPESITADIAKQREQAQVEDYFHLILDYGVMRAVLHSTTLAHTPGPRFLVHGDAGSFMKFGIDGQEDALKQGRRPGHPQWGIDAPENYGHLNNKIVPTLPGAYEQYYAQLAECLKHNIPPPVDPKDSRNGLRVIEAALQSARERRTITL